LQKNRNSAYYAAPVDGDLFHWHFTIRGARRTAFEGGVYHGRIIFPPSYPNAPPNIVFLTPNGRFEVGTKICLSISAHHPETWQPAWGVRLMLEALISFLPTPGENAIGALDAPDSVRQDLAVRSQSWSCEVCGPICDLLTKEEAGEAEPASAAAEEEDSAAVAARVKELAGLRAQMSHAARGIDSSGFVARGADSSAPPSVPPPEAVPGDSGGAAVAARVKELAGLRAQMSHAARGGIDDREQPAASQTRRVRPPREETHHEHREHERAHRHPHREETHHEHREHERAHRRDTVAPRRPQPAPLPEPPRDGFLVSLAYILSGLIAAILLRRALFGPLNTFDNID
jgi:ubiquitin-conjugating enzyme E2 J1